MKKLYLLVLTFLVTFIGLMFVSSLKPSTNNFKAIYQSYGYVYNVDKRIEIDLYSKDRTSSIENVNKNSYYLVYEDVKILLNNVNVSKDRLKDYYIYKLSFDIIKPIENELIIEDANLYIENDKFKFTINVGMISIINNDYTPLPFSDIYASYSYLDGALMLVGINIVLDGDFKRVSNLSVNGISYTNTSMILEGELFPNEVDIKYIIPDYRFNSILRSHKQIKSNTLFIPVTYEKLIFIKGGYIVITLDGTNYLINEFDFIFNDVYLEDYEKYIMESINAKA